MDSETRHIAEAGNYRPASVRIDDYDPGWPQRYADEATLLSEALGSRMLAVEHVGSTSIPDMPSKPVIDILAALPDYTGFHQIVQRLESVGYAYTPESAADDPGRRVFRKGPDAVNCRRTHHLHVTDVGSHYWQRIIAFRDHLRSHPDAAAAYAALKGELAVTHAQDSRS